MIFDFLGEAFVQVWKFIFSALFLVIGLPLLILGYIYWDVSNFVHEERPGCWDKPSHCVAKPLQRPVRALEQDNSPMPPTLTIK